MLKSGVTTAAVGGRSRCYLLVILVLRLLPICSMACEDDGVEICNQITQSQDYLCYLPDVQEECCKTCSEIDRGIQGCKFGDRNPELCSQDLLECTTAERNRECCETCAAVSTTETLILPFTVVDELDSQTYATDTTRANPTQSGNTKTSYPSVSMETLESRPTKPTTLLATTEDSITRPASKWPFSHRLAEQVITSESPEIVTMALDDAGAFTTELEMELLMTTEAEEQMDDVITPETGSITEDLGKSEEAEGTTVRPPATISYETSEPTETPSTTSPVTKEDLSTHPSPPTDNGEVDEYTDDYITRPASVQPLPDGEVTGSESPKVETSAFDDAVDSTTDFEAEWSMTTEVEEQNDDMTTPEIEGMTEDSGKSEETDGTTVWPPATISYETSEPTETPLTTSPVTKEDFSTHPYPPTDNGEVDEYTDDMTSEHKITDDEDMTTSVNFTVDANDSMDKTTTKYMTVSIPVTVSYETSEPTEIPTTASPSTKEDLSTQPHSSNKADHTDEQVTTDELEMTTEIDIGETTNIIIGSPTTSKQTTALLPKTVSYETSEPVETTSIKMFLTSEDFTTDGYEPTTVKLTTKESSTNVPPELEITVAEEPVTEDTTDEKATGEVVTPTTPYSQVITTMFSSSPRTAENYLTTLDATTVDWPEAVDLTTTELTRTTRPVTTSKRYTTDDFITTIEQSMTTTDEKYPTDEESVTTAPTTMLVTFTTVEKDDETNPIADPHTTTTPLPSNCSERNTFDDCEVFLMNAPYLCYDDDIQQRCCSTCISIANARKAEIRTSNCPYGDQERYCEDLDGTTCHESRMTREHCCESCHKYLEFNTVTPRRNTMTTAETTVRTGSTSYSSSKYSTVVMTTPTQSATIARPGSTSMAPITTSPPVKQPTSDAGETSPTTVYKTTNLPSSSQQPTPKSVVKTAGKQLGFQAGNLEGTASILVVVLPAIAIFVIILLVVLFVTIRHTSRVQRYLFQRQPDDDENAQLENGYELR